MTAKGMTMADLRVDPTPGAGEAALKARRRRLYTIIGALALSGFVVGFLSARFEREGGGFLEGIPAEWAIAASAIYLLTITIGTWRYYKVVDELERHDNRWAMTMALNLYLIGYPIWFMLWKGGLVPEPSHEIIFVVLYLALMAAYGWKKFRP